MSDRVLAHNIKKYLEAFGTKISEANVDAIADHLIVKPQYKLENKATFREDISRELNLLNSVSSSNANSRPVLDLNRSMTANETKQPSKRQRPAEVSGDSDGHGTDGDTNGDVVAVSSGDPNSVDETIAKKVIRKINKKRQFGETRDNNESSTTTLRKASDYLAERPIERLSDLAGLDKIQSDIQELVFHPMKYPDLFQDLGVTPPCGILLHGPSGCGKTTLAYAIAGELDLPFFKVSGPELVGGISGESEKQIKTVFEAAAFAAPSVLFIDAVDVLAGKKDNSQRGMERRIIAQLADCIDYLSNLGNKKVDEDKEQNEDEDKKDEKKGSVVLIVATNKPDNIDSEIRGRFTREIALPVPDAPARTKILQLLTKHMTLGSSVDFIALGKATPGFVGADLKALSREAGLLAVSRIIKSGNLEDRHVEMSDFALATKSIQPTAKKEGFAVAPNVTWNDVGALAEVRNELLHNVLEPIAHPERFKSLGLEVPAGVLFFGPPGCGKTLLAKALANQSGANFISVKGPELLNMYVGESESKVRQVFARARSSAPCVVFFDEIDALVPKRSAGEGNGVSDRVVNQLLTELDGLEERRDVYIVAATNRLELIDPAMLRPGRLGKLLYVPLPSAGDRVSILTALTRKINVKYAADGHESGVDLSSVANDVRCDGFSGADLAALVREAGMAVYQEAKDSISNGDAVDMNQYSGLQNSQPAMDVTEGEPKSVEMVDPFANLSIMSRHFETAFKKVRASVAEGDRHRFALIKKFIGEGKGGLEALKAASAELNFEKKHK